MRLADVNITSMLVGLIFMGAGTTVAIVSSSYPLGDAGHMGPGYLPLACGLLLIALGIAVVVFEGWSTTTARGERPDVRAWFFITASILVFAAMVNTLGFVPAVLGTSLTSLLANPRLRPVSGVVTSVVIAALATVIFVYGLRLNVEVFKWAV